MTAIQKNHLFTLNNLQEIVFRRPSSRGSSVDSIHFQLRRVCGKSEASVFTDTDTGHAAKLVEKGGAEKELTSQQDSLLCSGSRIVFKFTDGADVSISFRWACLAEHDEEALPQHSYGLFNVEAPDDFKLKSSYHGTNVFRQFEKI